MGPPVKGAGEDEEGSIGLMKDHLRAGEWESTVLVRWLLVLPMAAFGALTIATHGARFLPLTFQA
jgi:hypothetical protein